MGRKKLIQNIFIYILNIFLIPIAILLFLIRLIFRIQFIRIRDNRIGHLAANTEIFLRRLDLGIVDKRIRYIGIASKNPSNKQLLKMFKRVIPIIQINQPFYIRGIISEIARHSILGKSGLFIQPPFYANEYYEFKKGKPNLRFSISEEKQGKDLLNKLNVHNNWFICFHARDSTYLKKHYGGRDTSILDFRDSNINNYLKGIEYVTSKGGHAIRMGAKVKEKLDINNSNIIDYATLYRTDFGDIYLSAKCKFFLGDGCGINQVAQIFNVPVAWANVIPMKLLPLSERDLFIPKKVWSIEENRFLTFNEIIERGIIDYYNTSLFKSAKLKVVENSPEEILDLVMEMNGRLDGTWEDSEEDEQLQKKFKSLFKPGVNCHGCPARISARFLRKNKELLKNEK